MIAHIDADAFFASVLQRRNPRLRGKPLLALGMGGGCVIAASYEAKNKGVRTGMRLSEARRLVPNAIWMPSDFNEALNASRQIEMILRNQLPIVERMSVDEWYIDLRMLQGGIPLDIKPWALSLQNTIEKRVGITVSIGVGSSKLLAKMSGEYRKPAGVTLIDNKDMSVQEFLQDRPAAAIPGIGRRRQLHADSHNWKTAWDIATADKDTIVHLFGKPGLEMQSELLGHAVYSVTEDTRPPQSISRCRSFKKTLDKDQVFGFLMHHLSYCVLKLRRKNLMCTAVSVWLRNGDYNGEGKDSKLPQPSDTEAQLFPYVRSCFDRLYTHGTPYTQVGLALYNMRPKGAKQYSLFDNPQKLQEEESVQNTLDELHEKHGKEVIIRGSMISANTGSKRHLHEY